MTFSNGPSSPGGSGGNQFPSGNNKFPQVDHKAIVDFVDQFSVAILYWKAIKCPCVTGESGQPKLACPSCKGLGWAYSDPESDSKYQRAMVHSRRSQRLNDRGGWMTQGYSSITLLPGVIPGEGDLVQVCKDREVINDEYHVAGSKLLDGSTAETLRFTDVICVERVVVEDAVSKKVVTIPEDQWEFDKVSRTIQFHTPLPDGTQYAIRYLAVPEYIIKAETAKPYLRVAHDDNAPEPARFREDIVYPFNVQAIRLDRAVLNRHKAVVNKPGDNDGGTSVGGPFA